MISVAIQKGNLVYAYDEKNHQVFSRLGTLYGYTSGSVSIKKGDMVYTYDEKGHQISSHLAR